MVRHREVRQVDGPLRHGYQGDREFEAEAVPGRARRGRPQHPDPPEQLGPAGQSPSCSRTGSESCPHSRPLSPGGRQGAREDWAKRRGQERLRLRAVWGEVSRLRPAVSPHLASTGGRARRSRLEDSPLLTALLSFSPTGQSPSEESHII